MLSVCSSLPAPDWKVVKPTAAIPRENYRSWALFLVCNPTWLLKEKSAQVENLFENFLGFGEAIGKKNLAVWFWKRQMRIVDPSLPQNVDVARGTQYCSAMKLLPSKGPYVVITKDYPDANAFPRERVVLEIGAMTPSEVTKLMASLADQLLIQGSVTVQPPPAKEASWTDLLESARLAMLEFGCRFKVQVSAPGFSAETRECVKP